MLQRKRETIETIGIAALCDYLTRKQAPWSARLPLGDELRKALGEEPYPQFDALYDALVGADPHYPMPALTSLATVALLASCGCRLTARAATPGEEDVVKIHLDISRKPIV